VSRTLHWFRSDLRLHDNTALHTAAASGELLCLYIATPQQWQQHDDASIKQDFWRRNLQLLEPQLARLDIPLLYAEVPDYASIPGLLEQLLPALGIKALHCNREYPLNEHRRDQQVRQICQSLGVHMQVHEDQMLLPPEAVLNKSGQPYKVFTPYSRVGRELLGLGSLQLSALPGRQTLPSFKTPKACHALQQLSWPAANKQWATLWPAGEDHAWQVLQEFAAEKVASYKQLRDFPALPGTSTLSPQLAAGVLSVRQCWQASLHCEPGAGVFTWQNELLWRDFYKQVMWHFPRVSKHCNWREDLERIPWRHDEAEFSLWCEGHTGIPIVDAAMRQLLHTGWMHNRLRMLVAMFLSKHLLIDWRWGERWFMQHLIDGDFSANNGGWQWSASTGTDAVPYFRIFNPVTQSRRFDPEGTFIRQWVPELAGLDKRSIHEPGILKPVEYPGPMIDLKFGRERALNAFKFPV
jgi:deoxyribodipyrimidine photo-lyase